MFFKFDEVSELLDGDIPKNLQISWGQAPSNLAKSFSCSFEDCGIAFNLFHNGIYAKSDSIETDLNYGESTQLEISSTSLYVLSFPRIYDGSIYFGYNWKNGKKQKYEIPVHVADIGYVGREIYLFAEKYDFDSDSTGSYQTINDIVDLPPTVQNEYKIDYGPKVSEFTEARVKLQISQELTLEREAFEASAQLTNKLNKDLFHLCKY
jgi:hypothetical protein